MWMLLGIVRNKSICNEVGGQKPDWTEVKGEGQGTANKSRQSENHDTCDLLGTLGRCFIL